jgi:uncharacterized delta-60 repeat protein
MEPSAEPLVQRDGKIVVAGATRPGSISPQLTVVRLEADGGRDKDFGTNGVAAPAAGAGLRPNAAIVQRDAKLVVAGAVVNASGTALDNFTLVRLRGDGSTDQGFGDNGRVVTPTGEQYGRALAAVQQDDGRLVVAGDSAHNVVDQFGNHDEVTWLLRRYDSDGALDKTFGSKGAARYRFEGNRGGYLADLAETNGGRLLATGDAWFETGLFSARIALARFAGDGELDGGFGSSGSVLTQVPAEQTGTPSPSQASDLAVDPDGRIVVVGQYLGDYREPNSFGWAVVRYRADGSRDSSFGRDGFVTSVRGPGQGAGAVVLDPNGKLVVGGTSRDCGRAIMTIVRYFADERSDGGPTMRACATSVPLGPDDELPVSVQCPFVEDECNGTVTVEIPPAELTSSSRKAKAAVKVGASKFSLASGATGKASIKAQGRGLELLRKRRAKRAVLVFVARDSERHRRVTRRSVKIRLAR